MERVVGVVSVRDDLSVVCTCWIWKMQVFIASIDGILACPVFNACSTSCTKLMSSSNGCCDLMNPFTLSTVVSSHILQSEITENPVEMLLQLFQGGSRSSWLVVDLKIRSWSWYHKLFTTVFMSVFHCSIGGYHTSLPSLKDPPIQQRRMHWKYRECWPPNQ